MDGIGIRGNPALVDEDGASADTNRPGPGPIAPGPVTTTILAENLLFDQDRLVANAGSEFNIILDNLDSGVLHNIAFYTDRSTSQAIFVSELFTGPDVQESTFTAPSVPGNYFFRCDVHPDTMTGTFIVR